MTEENKDLSEEVLRARAEELNKREEALAKKEAEMENRTAKENFYENFRKVPVKYLDILIGACAVAIVVVIILGMLKGRGIF